MSVSLTLTFPNAALAAVFLDAYKTFDSTGEMPAATPGKPGRKPKTPVDSLGNPEGTRYFLNTAQEGVFRLLPGDPDPGVPSTEITSEKFKELQDKIAASLTAAAPASSPAPAPAPAAASASTQSAGEFDPFGEPAAAVVTEEQMVAKLKELGAKKGRPALMAILDAHSKPNASGQKLVSGIPATSYATVFAEAEKALA